MFWSKACKRCNGDIYLRSDSYGHCVSCVQCGAVIIDSPVNTPLASIVAILEHANTRKLPA